MKKKNLEEAPRVGASGQMILGTEKDGFALPLRETDERYLRAKKACIDTYGKVLGLKEKIKDMRDEALMPIAEELKADKANLEVLERLYYHDKIRAEIEEARIKSLEENATFIVGAVSVKWAKDKENDWCFVCSIPEFFDMCASWGTQNVFKIAEFDNGKPVGKHFRAEMDAPESLVQPETSKDTNPAASEEDPVDNLANLAESVRLEKEGAA
jgi:hypothetical protein